jgi:nucleoside-diphosphate-sugar epimerase
MMVATYARSFGIASATLRATLVAGEGQAEPNAISEFAETALAGGVIDIYGDGSHRREWLHPADLASAVSAAVDWLGTRDGRVAERFIVSSRSPIGMADLAGKVIARVGRGELTFSHPTAQAFSLTTSSTRARDLLAWEAGIDIDEIVDRVVSEALASSASPR